MMPLVLGLVYPRQHMDRWSADNLHMHSTISQESAFTSYQTMHTKIA